jgi:20S proteasome subunit alpha 7
LSATTYSPDGKVFQTDYAQKAVDNSSTLIGLRCKDGVVLAVEKLIVSKLLEKSENRISNIAKHAGIATAGLAPDGRQVASRAAEEAENYLRTYGDIIPAHVLCERLASYVHLFTLYWSMRPYGVTSMVASYDANGAHLHVVEPSGNACKYFGTAVGKGRQAAKTEIEKLKLDQLTCREAVVEVVKILYKIHDDDGKPFEIEMSWVSEESNKQHEHVPAELVADAERLAKAAMDDDDMDDD